MKTAVIASILILGFVGCAYAKGAKTNGDSCNIIASGIQFFSNNKNNYADACDTDKGLVCAINTCTCLPGYRFDQNFIEKIAGVGGGCVSGAQAVGALGGLVLAIAVIVVNIF